MDTIRIISANGCHIRKDIWLIDLIGIGYTRIWTRSNSQVCNDIIGVLLHNNFQFMRNMMKIGPTTMLSNEFSPGTTSMSIQASIVASFEFELNAFDSWGSNNFSFQSIAQNRIRCTLSLEHLESALDFDNWAAAFLDIWAADCIYFMGLLLLQWNRCIFREQEVALARGALHQLHWVIVDRVPISVFIAKQLSLLKTNMYKLSHLLKFEILAQIGCKSCRWPSISPWLRIHIARIYTAIQKFIAF
jgi:hypothetical protein